MVVKWSLFVALVAAGWRYYQSYNYRRLPPVVEGFFLPEFRPVAELFRYVTSLHSDSVCMSE